MNIMSSIQPKDNAGDGAATVGKKFGAFLSDAINNLNQQQQTVDQLNESFVKGELSDVHQLTIASEKASIGLELTVQVRNKVIEAYQDIMRMQL
ncbi:flagellar hook-basal body complex protein FliE [Paenibacillus athensensis]|uniref:Flagellar hook-basal body complex protein FliE n=2 Tax=Paenibacillus athensensis TaxID=1967502 RepID=A0A4Y8QC33_9BACL|nr:flagellar hook-basal body complex protein FliE [Paenibacillus athensensis]